MEGIKPRLFLFFMCTIGVSYAQPGGDCSEAVSVNCPFNRFGERVPCLSRSLPPSAPADEPNYVCDCSTIEDIGFDCGTRDLGHGEDGFITCYGIECASGFFESRNYPLQYPNSWEATYQLYIPGASRIDFEFVGEGGFGVEAFKDELYVGEGLLFNQNIISQANITGSNTVDGRVVYFFDNQTLETPDQIYPERFSLETDTVWLYFQTDKTLIYNGWRLQWTSLVDNTAPFINQCPQNIEAVIEFGMATGVVVNWTNPTANDVSLPVTSNQTHFPGDFFFVGTTDVIYIFSDRFGNSRDCSFTVTVDALDTVPPVVTCPADVTAVVELGTPGVMVEYGQETVTDLSETQLLSRSHQSGSFFPVGTTQVSIVYSDTNSNIGSCTFNVIVNTDDRTPPVIAQCPADVMVSIELGTFFGRAFWIPPTATDLSGFADLSSLSNSPGDDFGIGKTIVRYVFSDDSGNTATCEFCVLVETIDTTPPVIQNCPGEQRTTIELGQTSGVVVWSPPTATDNSGVAFIQSQSHFPGESFPVGITPVLYTFVDPEGLTSDCSFLVNVIPVDTTPPVVINGPPPITRNIELGLTSLMVTWPELTSTDISATQRLISQSHAPGTQFPPGDTTVTYLFGDESGNTITYIFCVSVLEVDTTPPVVINGPPPITRNIELGLPSLMVTWPELTSTDISTTQRLISQSHAPGAQFPPGDTTVTYLFGDESGNTITYVFCVSILQIDTVAPTITNCPVDDIAVTIELGETSGIAFWSSITATDLSGVSNLISQTASPGDDFIIGRTAVTYDFVDASGNVANCEFAVVVTTSDTVAPVISMCPNFIRETVELGLPGRIVNFPPPTATDVSGFVNVDFTHTPGTFFDVGTTVVTYTFTDGTGNSDMCTFVVTVETVDTTPPVISGCPIQPVVEQVELGTPGITATWPIPTATDLSDPVTVVVNQSPGSFFLVGTTVINYTFTDAENNMNQCIFDVVVITIDTTPPTISNCPTIIESVVELGVSGTMVDWMEPTATDESGVAELTRSRDPNTFFIVGDTTVIYTFEDASGNAEQCMFTVRVTTVDTTSPTVTCPDDIMVTIELGDPDPTITYAEPIAFDLSPTMIITQSHSSGDAFSDGVTTVTYLFSDTSSNNAVCTFDVTVLTEDTTPPTISNCPGTQFITVELGTGSGIGFWEEPTASDLSGSAFLVSRSHMPGDSFPVGQTFVMYTFADLSMNENICQFLVVVNTVDTTPPVISNCPGPITETIELGMTVAQISWTQPTATDESGVSVLNMRSHAPDSLFPVGATTVTYVFSDDVGNLATCNFTVLITTIDTTPPVIGNCPLLTISVNVELGEVAGIVNYNEPLSTDVSGTDSLVSRSATPGMVFPLGDTTVIYLFSDESGNTATCQFCVRVGTVDTTAPDCSGLPAEISECVELGEGGITIDILPEPTCVDISGTGFVSGRSHNPGSFFLVGDTTVTYTCSDASGNSATCDLTVRIVPKDTIPPIISNCPDDIPRVIELGPSSTVVSWSEPSASDVSGSASLSTRSHDPGSSFMLGLTTVVYIFVDPTGNAATCSFMVNVTTVDTTPPTIENCPSMLERVVELGTSGAVMDWMEPSASDVSGVAMLVTRSHAPGSFFNVGTTQVSYTFTDGSGNQAVCAFIISIIAVDTTPPVCVDLPGFVTDSVELGTIGRTLTWPEPTCGDASNAAVVTSRSHPPGSFFLVGETEVMYTCTDPSGNSDTCSFPVSVLEIDTTPPEISGCPSDAIRRTVELGLPSLQVFYPEPTATDLDNPVTVVQTCSSGDSFDVGETSCFYTFRDPSDNQNFCSFTIIVTSVDTTPPSVLCTDDVMVTVEVGQPSAMAFWEEPTASDPFGVAILESRSHVPGSSFTEISTTVSYVFIDLAGNTATCVFCVTLDFVDTTPPVCQNLPDPINEVIELGLLGTLASWTPPTCFDLSNVAFIASQSAMPNSFFPVGTTDVEYICQDGAGLTTTCSFPVTVTTVDTTPPEISGCPSDAIRRTVELGLPSLQVFYPEPTATDLDDPVTVVQTCSSGDSFDVGETTCFYTFRDPSDNQNFCSFTVIVTSVDTTPPEISGCPSDAIRRTVELGLPSLQVFYPEPTATDLDNPVTVVQTCSSGDSFDVGETTCFYTFEDPSNNQNFCSFTIIVTSVDTTPPSVLCTDDVMVTVEVGQPSAMAFWEEPTASDPFGVAILESRSHVPGSSFTEISTTVSYVFIDLAGNTATCVFCVTLDFVDTTPPVCQNLPDPINEVIELGLLGTLASWTPPTCFDLSNVAFIASQSAMPNSFFPVGTTDVEYICQDGAGLTTTCSFPVTVTTVDTTDPEITCPNVDPIVTEVRTGGTIVTWLVPTATDLSPTSVTCTRSPGDFYTTGMTTVTCTAVDQFGNSNFCTFVVSVIEVDSIPPDVTCPSDISVVIEVNTGPTAVNIPAPTVSDNSLEVPTLVSRTPPSGTLFNPGETIVTFIYTDSTGNQNSCSVTVTVTEVDTMMPVISGCPGDIMETTTLELRQCVITWSEPQVSDNSGVVSLLDQTHFPNSIFPEGVTTVTYTYTDPTNNQASCSFQVTCTPVDEIDPVVICPPTFMAQTSLEVPFCSINDLPEPQASDNSDTVFLISQVPPASMTQFPVGDTTVTFTYGDPSGNRNDCSFLVICEEVDEVDPVVICPPTVILETSLEVPFCAVNDLPEPQASDNSGNVFLIGQVPPASMTQFTVGETMVTFTYGDPSSNQNDCSLLVICEAVDRVNPVIICPPDVLVTVIEGLSGTTVFFSDPQASDNSGVVATVNVLPEPNTFFPVGTTAVTATAVDGSGNSAGCTFNVIVQEGNPCDPNPCDNGGFCAVDSLTMFTCVCSECFTGRTCSISIDACADNVCQNGATCVSAEGACDHYRCECPPCYSGEFCQDFRDACENHQCQGGSTCCPDTTCLSYSCQCPPCFDGPYCENEISPCQTHNCQNSALCIPDLGGDCSGYTCSCTGCFTGVFCNQVLNACLPNPCQNGALCTPDALDCYRYTCQCNGCFTGTRCEIAIPDPCQPNPCLSGGVCSRVGASCSSFTCACQKGFIGILCEIAQSDNSNPCNSFPCENGASCVESGSNYICLCRNGFAGINCREPIAFPPQFDLACSRSPCSSGAECVNSFHSASNNFIYQPQYTCRCPNLFTGENCQDFAGLAFSFCTPNPCSNGGTCSNAYHSFMSEVDYVCNCPVGFRGQNCESDVGNPCDSSPCENGGTCTPLNTYFTCSCQFAFVGDYCQTPTGLGPLITVTGCPGDITVNSPTGSVPVDWASPNAFGGVGTVSLAYQSHSPGDVFTVGETPVTYVFTDSSERFAECSFFVIVQSANRCSPDPCQNGGTCLPVGSDLCDCTGTGFTGDTCSDPIVVLTPCPGDITRPSNQALTTVDWMETGVGTMFFISARTAQSGTQFPVGMTSVTITYFDIATGTATQCTFTITIIFDITPPTFDSCPEDMVINSLPAAAVGLTIPISWNEPTYDDEGGTVMANQTHSPEDGFTIGEDTNVIYTIVDAAGNVATCDFVVRLQVSMAGRKKRDVEVTFSNQDACPCVNGGSCLQLIDRETSFCLCPPGFDGTLCEEPKENKASDDEMTNTLSVTVVSLLVIITICLLALTCIVVKQLAWRPTQLDQQKFIAK